MSSTTSSGSRWSRPAPPAPIPHRRSSSATSTATHLGSASLELDDRARIISYEEYYPYGSTSYQGVRTSTETPKRYRYTGQERDEESGFAYHGARYFAPWLGRWLSPDPAGFVDGPNLYAYVRGNPVVFQDPGGTNVVPDNRQAGSGPASQFTVDLLVKTLNRTATKAEEAEYNRRLQNRYSYSNGPSIGVVNPNSIPDREVAQNAQDYVAVLGMAQQSTLVAGSVYLASATGRSLSEQREIGEVVQNISTFGGNLLKVVQGLRGPSIRGLSGGQRESQSGAPLEPPILRREILSPSPRAPPVTGAPRNDNLPVSPENFRSPDRHVGELANAIEAAYPGHVVGVNIRIYSATGKLVTDADILLRNAVIQVKGGGGKKLTSQVRDTGQGTDLPVIGYGPSLSGSVVKGIEREGGLVTRDVGFLIRLVAP